MNNKTLIPILGAAGIGAAVPAQAQAQQPRLQQQRPNVIIILADDLGFGDISCNGSTTISTPNVDRVASSGVRFTNAHATSSVSTPARFGLLTGEYPWRYEGTGIAAGDAGMIIPAGTYTMPIMGSTPQVGATEGRALVPVMPIMPAFSAMVVQ